MIEGLNDVEGVPPGAFALFFKVHHSMVDGQGGLELFGHLSDLAPEGAVTAPTQVWTGERVPSQAELLALALAKQPARLAGLARMGISATNVPKLLRTLSKARGSFSLPPMTRFGGQVSAHRTFDGIRVELSEVKRIKSSIPGATVNDVALAIVGGAMRRYLLIHDELPEQSMTAAVPVSTRGTAAAGTGANQVDGAMISMATDLDDDRERLIAISALTHNITDTIGGSRAVAALTEVLPTSLLGLGLRAGMGLPARSGRSLTVNATVTNVAGPQFPVFMFGARVVSTYGIAPVLDGIGLCNVIMSYLNELTISAISCREIMPDPAVYAECLRDSFEALSKAC